MPGGKQALNNPATKQAFSSTVKSFAKGGAEEISQGAIEEGFTHIASEMNKGKTFNEAATSFAEQFPQSALTSALLGGGVQAMADKKNASAQPQQSATAPQPALPQQPAPATPPASAPQQPPSPAQAQHSIPHPTTPGAEASGSGQQSQTAANNRQPPQTPSPSGSAQQPQTTANDRQPPQTSPPAPSLPPPTTAPKSPEQSQRLINNVMNRPPEQRGHPQVQSDVAQAQSVLQDHVQKLENQTEPLNDTQKKELTDAKATLSRLPAEKPVSTPESGRETSNTDTTPDAARQSRTQPADAPPTHGPDTSIPPESGARRPNELPTPDQEANRSTSDARPPISPDTPPQDQPSGAERSRDGSAADPSRRLIPESTTHADSDPANPKAAAADQGRSPTTPESPSQDGAPPRTTNSGQPSQTSPTTPRSPGEAGSPGQPASPSRGSLPPPQTPPMSVEQSRKLIENVSKMHPQAQLHPQVQADLAQARDVVDGHMQKLKGQSSARSDVRSDSRQSDASPAHAPATAKTMPREGSQTGGKAVEQSHTPHQGQPPVAPKVTLSSSAPKLTPQQQANIPHITQTAKTLLAKLTAAHASQFPDLKNPIIESADVCDVTQSGMWLNEDFSIGYHLPTLAAEMAIHNDHAIPGYIETRFNNLLQASPEYNSPVQKNAPQQISQSGTQPGVNAPNTFATVETGVKPHLKEWGRIDGEIHQWETDLDRATEMNDSLAMDRIQTKLDALEVQRQGLVDQVHRLLEVPRGMRTPFTFADLTPTSRTAAIRGAALAERYIHPDLLPKMGAVDFNSRRAGQFRGMLLIHRLSDK